MLAVPVLWLENRVVYKQPKIQYVCIVINMINRWPHHNQNNCTPCRAGRAHLSEWCLKCFYILTWCMLQWTLITYTSLYFLVSH